MLEFGLFGGDFQHAFSSTLWKPPTYFHWTKNQLCDVNFFVDKAIFKNVDTKCPHKYAWVVESRVVIPSVISEFKAHWQEISQAYTYVFTHHRELYSLADNFIYLPPHGYWIREPHIYKKTKLASLISSTKNLGPGHVYRLEWVKRLKDKVDVYGRGFKTTDRKEIALQDYMFSVTIENDQYETYWTEKILDCFVSGTIPVYHGAPDIEDFFNPGGIIILEEGFDPGNLSRERYESMTSAIYDNFRRALEFEIIEDIFFLRYLKDPLGL